MALEFSVSIGPLNLAEFTQRILQKYSEVITEELRVRTPGPDKKIWKTADVTDGVLISNKSRYLPYVLKGTGLHGPRHDWIRPKKAMVLSWEDDGKRVFVAKSAGMKARPFVTESIEAGRRRVSGDF